MKMQSYHSQTELGFTQQEFLPTIFNNPTKDITFLTGARLSFAPVFKLNQNKIFHNKKFSLDSMAT